MKIRAGVQLCGRKPAHPQESATSSTPTLRCPVMSAGSDRAAPVTHATLAAAPSMLSSRLKELVMTTIHSTGTT